MEWRLTESGLFIDRSWFVVGISRSWCGCCGRDIIAGDTSEVIRDVVVNEAELLARDITWIVRGEVVIEYGRLIGGIS